MNKKLLKSCFSIILLLSVFCTAFTLPDAESWLFDYELFVHDIYFQQLIDIDAKVVEETGTGIKKNVAVQGMGQSPCYVKAMLVFTAIDKETGAPLSNVNIFDDTNISIKFPDTYSNLDSSRWLSVYNSTLISEYKKQYPNNGNFYPYIFIYNVPLGYTDTSDILVEEIKTTSEAYDLKVDIIVDAIYEGEVSEWCNLYGLTVDSATRTLSIA